MHAVNRTTSIDNKVKLDDNDIVEQVTNVKNYLTKS